MAKRTLDKKPGEWNLDSIQFVVRSCLTHFHPPQASVSSSMKRMEWGAFYHQDEKGIQTERLGT